MRNKLATKSLEAILVGYDDSSKAYRCYCPSDKKIYISRNVQFNETSGVDIPTDQTEFLDTQFFDSSPDESDSTPVSAPSLDGVHTGPADQPAPDQPIIDSSSPTSPQQLSSPLPSSPMLRVESPGVPRVPARPRKVILPSIPLPIGPRIRRTPRYLTDYYHDSHVAFQCHDPSEFALEILGSLDEDMTLGEALEHPGWSAAIQSEFDSLMENDTWDYCELPPD